MSPWYVPTLTKLFDQQAERNASLTKDVMTIKNVTIPLDVEYLQRAAKERGISRTKLVRIVMEKVVRDALVPDILTEDDVAAADTPPIRYRRFRDRIN
jgi:hypothetical protein